MSEPCWTEHGAYVALSRKGTRQYTLIFTGWKEKIISWVVRTLVKL